jgi:uncharacterized Zn-finger protein
MELKKMLRSFDFARIILILWLVSSLFILFSISRIDWIVHQELYNFGLQFSPVWANPYWISLRMIYVWLAIPAVLSAVFLGSDLWGKLSSKKPAKLKKPEAQALKSNHMLISCPSCKKIFRKPLVMLDFSSGKPRLVNVCPYCNSVLGKAYEESLETMQIKELDREIVH